MRILLTALLVFIIVSPLSAKTISADADSFSNGTDISKAFAGITLSTVGGYPGHDGLVYAWSDIRASTGTNVFDNSLSAPFEQQWMIDSTIGVEFKAEFDNPIKSVTIDIIGNDSSGDTGGLYAYNLAGELVGSIISPILTSGEFYSATINRDLYDIKYIIAGGTSGNAVHLDNLRAEAPEPGTLGLLIFGGVILARKRKEK